MASGRASVWAGERMEREAHYAAVGAFVLLVALLGTLFVYWYSDSREHRHYDRYEIFFTGSVSGLDKGAVVRYLGVGVGRVVDLRIDPRDSSRVDVVVAIDSRTPISPHTVAELQLQGVTGLLYIDLSEDRTDSRMAPAVAGLEYPVIRSSPSSFNVFLSSLPQLVAAANEITSRASRLLSDANLQAVTSALGNFNKASSTLPGTLHDVDVLVQDLRAAGTELGASARSAHELIDGVTPDVRATAQRLRTLADHLSDASSQLDQVIAENRGDLRNFTHEGLPEIERFVREGQAAAQDIRALANSLRDDPTQLLYEAPQRGVEIPK
jgi:phospholipid/cholesterol/gamma-HCH transport system substrate-binding protein